MCNVRFQIQQDVIEVVTRRCEMAGINVTNKLLESYIKDLLTIQFGVAVDKRFEITITNKGGV